MSPRTRRGLTATATAAGLLAVVAGVYFGFYAAVVAPEARRLADQVSLASMDPGTGDGALIPEPTEPGDAGPLYERALGLTQGLDAFAIQSLVAIARHTVPAGRGARVDLEALVVLRQAARHRQASLPESGFSRLERRAAMPSDAALADPLDQLGHLGMALVGAGEVQLVSGRADQAEADFVAAYTVGRHLWAGGCDAELRLDAITLRRMACAGLMNLAERASPPVPQRVQRLRQHLRLLAVIDGQMETKRALLSGTGPEQIGAVIKVAMQDPDPVWRRDAAVGLVRLSRLGFSSSRYAWLVRRRARAALADVADDPDPLAAALAKKALGRPVPALPTRPHLGHGPHEH